MKNNSFFSFRLDDELTSIVEAHTKYLQSKKPWDKVTRTSVIRELLFIAGKTLGYNENNSDS